MFNMYIFHKGLMSTHDLFVCKKKCMNFSKEAYASFGTKAIYVV